MAVRKVSTFHADQGQTNSCLGLEGSVRISISSESDTIEDNFLGDYAGNWA